MAVVALVMASPVVLGVIAGGGVPGGVGLAPALGVHNVPPAPWYDGPVPPEAWGVLDVPIDSGVAPMAVPAATTGTAKVVTIAIEFTDVKHNAASTITAIDSRVDGSNSVRTYYEEVSYGKLTVDGSTYGWYTAKETMAYYGAPANGVAGDNAHIDDLIREAVLAADSVVDFSQFDGNGDRIVDNVIVVHAGQDEAVGGGKNAIWSHQGFVSGAVRVDGVYVGYYLTVSEFSPMGVYAHEFGHLLGLPDLYDTDYTSHGVGDWDLMAGGAWGGYGSTPVHISAWCKVYLGWVTPVTVTNYVEGYEIAQMESSEPKIVKVPTQTSSEYFLLENRQQSGYDRYIPGNGLLIWHIDTAQISRWLPYNRVNNDEDHKGIDLEEASGTQDLDDLYGNSGDRYDPWYSNPTGFSPTSTPNTNLYDGSDTKIRIFNISHSAAVMRLDIDFGGDSYAVIMDVDNPIREASPGESIVYNVTVGTRSSLGDTLTLNVRGPQASWGSIPGSLTTVSLGPKGTRVVPLTVTPPAGTSKGTRGIVILHAASNTAGSMFSELVTTTIVRQVHLLSVEGGTSEVKVVPGTPTYVDLTITNKGNGPENITISMGAERSYWGTISPTEASITVLGTVTARATFSVPKEVLEGETEVFDLVIFVEVEGGVFEGVEQVTLKPVVERPITMVVDRFISLRWGSTHDSEVLPDETVSVELTLYNEGNHEARVNVFSDPPEGWTVALDDSGVLDIPAFQAVTFVANVTAPYNALAGTKVRIDVSAAEEAQVFQATIQLDVLQLFGTVITGPSAVFADPAQRILFPLNVTNTGNGNDRVTFEASNGGLWSVSVDLNFADLRADDLGRTTAFNVVVEAPTTAEAYEEGEFVVSVRSSNGQVTSQHQLAVTINPVSSFTASVEVGTDSVPPTGTAIFWVTVRNSGNLEDLYHLGVAGLPSGWTASLESRFFSVPPGKTKTVQLDIRPSNGASALSGTHPMKVQVASELGGGPSVELPITVSVQSVRAFSLSSVEPSYSGPSGARILFRVMVANKGNVQETVSLKGVGDFSSIAFDTPTILLEPYGSYVVNVTLELPSSKEDTDLDVRVLAISEDNTRQESVLVPVAVEGRSGMPGPSALMAIVAVTAVAAVSAAVMDRRRRRHA